MKKYLVLMVFVTIEMFGNELLKNIEGNANFSQPIETINASLMVRGDINQFSKYILNQKVLNQTHKKVQGIQNIDFSKVKETRICSYQDQNKKMIRAYFNKTKNRWVLGKVVDQKNKKLAVKKGILHQQYDNADAINCFWGFAENWENKYKNSHLKQVSQTSYVSGILVQKNHKVYNAIFNLKYINPTEADYRNGWMITFMKLSKSKHQMIQNNPIPKNHKSFAIRDVIDPDPNVRLAPVENGKGRVTVSPNKTPKVISLTCSQHPSFIRIAFELNQNKMIKSFLEFQKDKLVALLVDGSKAKINPTNCTTLSLSNQNGLYYIDLRKFDKHIYEVSYGQGGKSNVSYIDFKFQSELNILQKAGKYIGVEQ